ncbi:MAG: extracellular solute-binding protein [Micropruina sp.]|nr:extracellular solute-binding protein [Micropruina sp.]
MTTAAAALALGTLSACSPGSLGSNASPGATGGGVENVSITYMVDNGDNSVKIANAQAAAFMKANPTIKVTVDTRPQGTDGDNFVKTRLSTGEMADLFQYNSGSLLQALDPAKNLVPVTSEPWVANLDDNFKRAASSGTEIYGAPFGTATGGGFLYNRKVFADLGLTVPTTWAEFMANNAKIKAAGIDPVIQSYGDTWTSQLLVLADFNNINKADPQWAERYTKNDPTAKFAVDPALKGFQRLQDVHDAGYLNKNFASMKYDQAQTYLASGKGAQYPMITFAIPNMVANDAANKDNIGFFPQPGDDAATQGVTLWIPSAIYIPTTTTGAKLDAAKKFEAWAASTEACDVYASTVTVDGAFVVKGCELPDSVAQAVKDVQSYVDAGKSSPALEYLSPVKGPNMEKITVEVGSGITPALDGAKRYDEDVKKQAQQLGLEGW